LNKFSHSFKLLTPKSS